MGPSDSLVPVSLGSGSPCLGLPRGGRLVLCGAALRLGHDAGVTRQRAPCAGMVTGSPGMEMGSRKDRYDVLAFTRTGTTSVYASR